MTTKLTSSDAINWNRKIEEIYIRSIEKHTETLWGYESDEIGSIEKHTLETHTDIADLQRSIPSMVDGLNQVQRKIIFCSFKKDFVEEAIVVHFSGYVCEHSAYYELSDVSSTIIGMAQNYVGSNNINMLYPRGLFGSRLQGGKDHASPWHLFTRLCPIARSLFPKDDDMLLNYNSNEYGRSIEPTWYMPIIPTVLVNGSSQGMVTGLSSYIPNYNPRDIIANVRHLLNDEMMEPMHPWYRGFKGTIEKTATDETGVTYTISGVIEQVDETILRITELPVGRWTENYSIFLNSLEKDAFIKDHRDYSGVETVDILVTLTEENMLVAKQEGLLKKFKLTRTVSTSNMHLFDPQCVIKKYDTPEQTLEEFYHLRLDYYDKRKKALLKRLDKEILKVENKVRFCRDIMTGEILINGKADLVLELHHKGFTPFPKKTKVVDAAGTSDDSEETEENTEIFGSNGVQAGDYEYLLRDDDYPLFFMAYATDLSWRVRQLNDKMEKLSVEAERLNKENAKSLWLKDLDNLENELDVQDNREVYQEHGAR